MTQLMLWMYRRATKKVLLLRDQKRKLRSVVLRSVVWNDFELVLVDGVQKAKCNQCKRKLSATSRNGTTHLKTCPYNKKKAGVKMQTNLRFGTLKGGSSCRKLCI